MTGAAGLIAVLRGRGFVLSVAGGALAVRPAAALTPDDRAAIRRHLPAVVAALTTEATSCHGDLVTDAWNTPEMCRLMVAADTLVARLGVDGWHPEVAAAAAMVCDASATYDPATIRFAISRFIAVVTGFASRPDEPAGVGDAVRAEAGQPSAA